MQISISELKMYLQCPRSFKLREIDGVEALHKPVAVCRSAAVKKIVSALHKSDKKPCDYKKQEIDLLCTRVWKEEIADPKVSQEELNATIVQAKPVTKTKEASKAITKSEKVLEKIKDWVWEYSREEVDVEILYSDVYAQTTIGDITFVGYIDQVRKVGDQIQVLSFNTGNQAPDMAFLERDFCLSLLCHFMWQGVFFPSYPDLSDEVKLEKIPGPAVYYFPFLERYQKKVNGHKKGDRKGNPLIQINKTEQDLLEFEYELLYVVSGIEREFFPMMPVNPCRCAICPLSHACDIQHSVFGTNVSFDIEELAKEEGEPA